MNLRALCPYFYTVGMEVARLREDEELMTLLRETMAGPRFEKIFDWSRNAHDTDASDLLDLLSEEEREIYDAGFQAEKRTSSQLQTSDVFAKSTRLG